MKNKLPENKASVFLNTLGLFGSLSTFVCCAMPALFIALGAGASLVSLLEFFPSLIWFSENKFYTFAVSGFMLFLSCFFYWQKRNKCPVELKARLACSRLRRLNFYLLSFSVGIYAIAFFFAFIITKVID